MRTDIHSLLVNKPPTRVLGDLWHSSFEIFASSSSPSSFLLRRGSVRRKAHDSALGKCQYIRRACPLRLRSLRTDLPVHHKYLLL